MQDATRKQPENIYNLFASPIYSFSYYLTGSPGLAQQVASETFTALAGEMEKGASP